MHITYMIFNQIILKHWFCKMKDIFQNKMNEMQKFIEKTLQTRANLENKIFTMVEIQIKTFFPFTITSETTTIPLPTISNQKQSIWVQIVKWNPDTNENFQYVKKFKKTINFFFHHFQSKHHRQFLKKNVWLSSLKISIWKLFLATFKTISTKYLKILIFLLW